MAGKSKPPKHPEAKRVVDLVMKRLKAKNDEDLARELGMPPYSKAAMRKVQRWIAGDHAPYFDDLMLMFSESGSLDDEMKAAWEGTDYTPQRPDPLKPEAPASAETGKRKRAGA